LIIALFLLSFSGCGVKKPPYYQGKAPVSDENVEFIIVEPKVDKNIEQEVEDEI